MNLPFLAIHLGAGRHSPLNDFELTKLASEICNNVIQKMKGCGAINATRAVELAISMLEDNPSTNCGTGSNLNEVGLVECDAGIMEGSSGLCGAVAAISGVRNPIKLASLILSQQKSRESLVQPIIISGNGGKVLAKKYDLEMIDSCELISDTALNRFNRHMNILKSNDPIHFEVNDTVGAIAIDQWSNFTSGVSSGGISLKKLGRVGDSSIPGSGFWSCNKSKSNIIGFSCSTSGTGEQLIYSDSARALFNFAESNIHDKTGFDICVDFLENFGSKIKSNVYQHHEPSIGFIAAVFDGYVCEFWTGFTTDSMAVSYITGDQIYPTSKIYRKEDDAKYKIMTISI